MGQRFRGAVLYGVEIWGRGFFIGWGFGGCYRGASVHYCMSFGVFLYGG